MENTGRHAQVIEAPAERPSSLRIDESPDMDTALRAVLDGICSLTRAPHAVVTTPNESGKVEHYLALATDNAELLWQIPGGLRFFEHQNALTGSLGLDHPDEFAGSTGLGKFRSPFSLIAFMAAPILHRGALGQHLRWKRRAGRTTSKSR